MKIAVIVGTRPEAVKMAPVHRALVAANLEPELISTGQHLDLLRSALVPLQVVPAYELALMTPNQTPNGIASLILERMPPLLIEIKPAAVLVQGDTTTAFATALAAYHLGIPVGHVEAGLRTYDDLNPFPEEANRQLIARLTRWSFAPTELAKQNLLAERIDAGRIHVTGNTAVDSVLWMLEHRDEPASAPEHAPYLLLTLHRRESFGEPLRDILGAVTDFLVCEPAAEVVWPVHPNPAVRALATELFEHHPRVHLVAPLDYDVFASTLADARTILSDSGGVQEEAPSLGKRVLIARETTERPEAVHSGHNVIVGRERARIRSALLAAWHDPPYRGPLPSPNPYGDGHAATRIAKILTNDLVPWIDKATEAGSIAPAVLAS
ncbi:MAG TPA: UDP-N-acetylglucosamine 2-epimerase (non-hydrolyzing) [Dermatophilaceae bacterium]